MNINFFHKGIIGSPNLNASIRAQHKYEPTMKAVKVNCRITEVKQSMTKNNTKMGDHLGSIHFAFFQFGRYIRKIRQICQILLFSWNFRITSKNVSVVLFRNAKSDRYHWRNLWAHFKNNIFM